MANPARNKGTAAETELVRLAQSLGLEAQRAPNNSPSYDVQIGDWFVEVKHRKAFSLRAIISAMRRVHMARREWCVVLFDGDRRARDSFGAVVVFDLETGLQLLKEAGYGED